MEHCPCRIWLLQYEINLPYIVFSIKENILLNRTKRKADIMHRLGKRFVNLLQVVKRTKKYPTNSLTNSALTLRCQNTAPGSSGIL